MSKYYYELIEKINRINKEIKVDEKKQYPELVRSRVCFRVSFVLLFILYGLVIFSPVLFSRNILAVFIVLLLLVIDVCFVIFL